jgi:hypothetical protein
VLAGAVVVSVEALALGNAVVVAALTVMGKGGCGTQGHHHHRSQQDR